MTPKIVTRLANIAAKLAGSDKYDPTIEPKTAFEYYLNKGVDKILAIKGVPEVEAGDKGKVLSVDNSGTPKWENMGPLVVIFSGTSDDENAACDKTWEEISAAIAAGKELLLKYHYFNITYQLSTITYPYQVTGQYSFVGTPEEPQASDYIALRCIINEQNEVLIEKLEF